MKKTKFLFPGFLIVSLLSMGVCSSMNQVRNQNVAPVHASDTVKTISEIKGIMRPAALKIAIAVPDTVGTYGASYVGYGYNEAGTAMTLSLKNEGGASGDWTNGGTRRFTFDCTGFGETITNNTFILKANTHFVGDDCDIVFAKSYKFTHYNDGAIAFAEEELPQAQIVSFDIKELENRLSGTQYRVGVGDFNGLSAGFSDVFEGTVKDKNGQSVGATIKDAGAGSSAAGNRRVYIDLANDVSGNTFFIEKDSEFTSQSSNKVLKMQKHYKIAHTGGSNYLCSSCDGTNHTYGEEVVGETAITKTCEVCGHVDSTTIPTYTPTLGTGYYSTITAGDPNTEINLKVGGSSNLPTSAMTYRGKAELDGTETNVKITTDTSGNIRFYLYVDKDSDQATGGHMYISSSTKYSNDGGEKSYLQFPESFYLGYDNANHITKCDGVNHTFAEEVSDGVNVTKTCKGCGHVESNTIPTYTPTLGTGYYSTITAGDPNTEINLKVGGSSNLPTSAMTYRGKAELDGTETNVKITTDTSGNIRFYLYVDKDSDQATGGHMYISSSTKYSNDGGEKSYLQFPESFYLGYDNANHITKCDGANHTYGDAENVGESLVSTCKGCGNQIVAPIYTAHFGVSDKWCAKTSNEISIRIGGCTGIDGVDATYRGKGKLNGLDHDLKITIKDNNVRVYAYTPTDDDERLNSGVISIDANTLFKADGATLSYFKVDKSVSITYNNATNKYRIDETNYEKIDSVISNLVKKNWVSINNGEVALSYVNAELSNDAVVPSSGDAIYRGTGKVDGVDAPVRIVLSNASGKNKVAFLFSGNETGSLEILSNAVFALDTNGYYFSNKGANIPDTVSLDENLSVTFDAVNNMINVIDCTLSFSGKGNWSQPLDNPTYNVLASFEDCDFGGFSVDNSDMTDKGDKHRGYYFYGPAYNKNDEPIEGGCAIWVSEFKNGDDTTKTATVKTAVYANTNENCLRLHAEDLFLCSAYNLKLTIDDDYLIKWYPNTSRTTAGHYNNDLTGPTIYCDEYNLPEYTEGDSKPLLPASALDDVDDQVGVVTQEWEEGAIDANGKLVAGSWTVTLTVADSHGNEADPLEITVIVKEKQPEPPVDPVDEDDTNDDEPTKPSAKGCGSSIIASSAIVSIVSILGSCLIVSKKKID